LKGTNQVYSGPQLSDKLLDQDPTDLRNVRRLWINLTWNDGPRRARARPTGLGEADRPKKHVEIAEQSIADSRRESKPSRGRSVPDGTIPRPAGLGEAGRPHMAASGVPPWRGS
jgi:hypothetical protein